MGYRNTTDDECIITKPKLTERKACQVATGGGSIEMNHHNATTATLSLCIFRDVNIFLELCALIDVVPKELRDVHVCIDHPEHDSSNFCYLLHLA